MEIIVYSAIFAAIALLHTIRMSGIIFVVACVALRLAKHTLVKGVSVIPAFFAGLSIFDGLGLTTRLCVVMAIITTLWFALCTLCSLRGTVTVDELKATGRVALDWAKCRAEALLQRISVKVHAAVNGSSPYFEDESLG